MCVRMCGRKQRMELQTATWFILIIKEKRPHSLLFYLGLTEEMPLFLDSGMKITLSGYSPDAKSPMCVCMCVTCMCVCACVPVHFPKLN